jgi:cysteine-rich repeat protein
MRRFRGLFAAGFLLVTAVAASSCGSSTTTPDPKAGSGGSDSGPATSGTGGQSSGGVDAGAGGRAGGGGSSSTGGGSPITPDAATGPDGAVAYKPVLCGNGKVDPGEDCDDANAKNGDGCTNNCHFSCTDTNATLCSNGSYCDGPESCSADHKCLPSAGPLPDGTVCGQSQKCQAGACREAARDCGDGLIEKGEECEDGNQVNGDGCDNCLFTCRSLDATRNCSSSDPCPGSATCDDTKHQCVGATPLQDLSPCGTGKACVGGVCKDKYCSNGKVDAPGEECDDGNRVKGDGCENDCKFSCHADAECQSANACISPATCGPVTHKCTPLTPKAAGTACGTAQNCIFSNCLAPVCGDGVQAQGVEACDDGNRISGDGCESGCKLTCATATAAADCAGKTPPCRTATCLGNLCSSAADTGKNGTACLVGTGAAGTTCSAGRCGKCGDGVKDAGELCDDGNLVNGDGCEPNCAFSCSVDAECNDNDSCNGTETCVAGAGGKKCTPGASAADGTACGTGKICLKSSCRPSFCGDGITDAAKGEACDPPNTVGCDASCKALETCNLSGVWAIRVAADVTWGGDGVLEAGTGQIVQWAALTITQTAGSVSFSGALHPCGLTIPDFKTSPALGAETYGTTFPDALFDATGIPSFPVSGTLSNIAPGATVDTTQSAILLGVTATSPATPFDVWPADLAAAPGFTVVDQDGDGKPGITAVAKKGPLPGGVGSYLDPIFDVTDVNNPSRADRLYLAVRQKASQTGTLTSCTSMSGTTTAVVDNHIVGCHANTGVECASADLVDGVRPMYVVTGASFSADKLTGASSCSAVRAALP